MTDNDFADGRLIGHPVVLDLSSPYVVLGTLREQTALHYVLDDADVHDLRDTTTTRELYVLDAKRHGINSNRRRVFVRCEEVVSLALLADVME